MSQKLTQRESDVFHTLTAHPHRTSHQLGALIGICHENVDQYLRKLRAKGLAHSSGYQLSPMRDGSYRRRWHAGPGKDVELPKRGVPVAFVAWQKSPLPRRKREVTIKRDALVAAFFGEGRANGS